MEPPKELLGLMFERMVRIRRFEEKGAALINQGKLVGEIHVYIGEEASAVGVCAALRDDDYITSTHRGHGHVIAKGADVKYMMAELFGRQNGLCKGKGGSMHVADGRLGILGANAIVGGGLPIATGAALASQVRGGGQVAICFFGDGASNQGTFHESLNLSAVWKLPVVFVCENNKYHEFSLSGPLIAGSIQGRAAAYGIPGCLVDGQNVLAVYSTAREAVERARSGGGPTLIEVDTFRFYDHFVGEDRVIPRYRSPEEVEPWKKKDPIALFRSWLIEHGQFMASDLDAIDERIQREIEEAVAFADASPLPEPQAALEDVFSGTQS
jgi:TPP-dependent pyruvate/acetoin dehydrogenase alpha subunit